MRAGIESGQPLGPQAWTRRAARSAILAERSDAGGRGRIPRRRPRWGRALARSGTTAARPSVTIAAAARRRTGRAGDARSVAGWRSLARAWRRRRRRLDRQPGHASRWSRPPSADGLAAHVTVARGRTACRGATVGCTGRGRRAEGPRLPHAGSRRGRGHRSGTARVGDRPADRPGRDGPGGTAPRHRRNQRLPRGAGVRPATRAHARRTGGPGDGGEPGVPVGRHGRVLREPDPGPVGVGAGVAEGYLKIWGGYDGTWDNGVDRGLDFDRVDAAAAAAAQLSTDRAAEVAAVRRQAEAAFDRTAACPGRDPAADLPGRRLRRAA